MKSILSLRRKYTFWGTLNAKIKSFLQHVLRLYFGRKPSASFNFFYKNTGINDLKRNCVGSRLYGPLGFGIQPIFLKRVFYMFYITTYKKYRFCKFLASVFKLLTIHSEEIHTKHLLVFRVKMFY